MFFPEQVHARIASTQPAPDQKIILFSGKFAILAEDGDFPAYSMTLPLQPEPVLIGKLDGTLCFGAELHILPNPLPSGLHAVPSRTLLASSQPGRRLALSRTRELLFWRNRHRFCGCCRAETIPSDHDLALVCPQCHTHYYPQIAPAVIVAVHRNQRKELLLAHNRSFENGVFSLIAGFVECGETVEETIAREIMEETSVKVKNIVYLTSQTWPFPNSLMLAFEAEYDSGTVTPDGTELDQADWFSADALPPLPAPGSVARRVIGRFFGIDAGR